MQTKNSLYGPAFPEKNWVPAPRYILRRERILDLVSNFKPGKVLEVGCGAGTLLIDLAQRGFTCIGYEISAYAYQLALEFTAPYEQISLTTSAHPEWHETFEFLLAFEVLEHIENDAQALTEWTQWLKPGGKALFSVPAHRNKWTHSDVFAGHFRRYDRYDLIQLCEKAGLKVIYVEFYGFPIANIIAPARIYHHKKKLAQQSLSGEVRTRANLNVRSGIERSFETQLFKYLNTKPVSYLFELGFMLQKATRRLPWGNGLLILAEKV